MPPEDRYVDIDGLRLHYIDWSGEGPALVVLHGAGGNAHNWDGLGAALQGEVRFIALDQRAHGESDYPTTGFTPMHMAEDVVAFADALGLDRFDLLGHSMGARVSILFAGQYAHRLDRLILSDPPHYPIEDEVAREIGALQRTPQRFTSKAEAKAYLRSTEQFGEAPSDEALEERVAAHLLEQPDGTLTWRRDLQGMLGAIGYLLGDIWGSLPNISCPALMMRGTRSHLLSPEAARRMVAAMPNARLVELDAGHGLWREAPAAFLEALRSFLRKP